MSVEVVRLPSPRSRRRRLELLARALVTTARVELVVRRRPVAELCRSFGVGFEGLRPGEGPTGEIPRGIGHHWWAVESVLRFWPFARSRPCLRRSVILGHQLLRLAPVMRIEVLSTAPFVAHAWLDVSGHRLDMGDAGAFVG